MRDGVECDLLGVALDLQRTAIQQHASFVALILQPHSSRAGHGLIGADVDALNTNGVVDRLQRNKHLNGRAIRIRDDARDCIVGNRLGIDLGNDQRNVVVVAKVRGIVDHDTPAAAALGANSADIEPPAENRPICAREKSNSARSSTSVADCQNRPVCRPSVRWPARKPLQPEIFVR